MTQREYYDKVAELLRQKGYTKMPDRDTVNSDFDDDKTPEESADEFESDWGDPGDMDED